MEAQVAAVQTLLLSAEFGRALAVHNKVCASRNTPTPLPPPTCADSQAVVRDVSTIQFFQPSRVQAKITIILLHFVLLQFVYYFKTAEKFIENSMRFYFSWSTIFFLNPKLLT